MSYNKKNSEKKKLMNLLECVFFPNEKKKKKEKRLNSPIYPYTNLSNWRWRSNTGPQLSGPWLTHWETNYFITERGGNVAAYAESQTICTEGHVHPSARNPFLRVTVL